MAELKKVEDYQYDTPIMDESTTHSPAQENKVQYTVEVPLLPNQKLKSISLFEKLVSIVLLIAIVAVAVWTIQIRTSIDQVTNDITEMQGEMNQKEEATLKLEQEKSELSKADRIKKIAKDKGLAEHDENLRNVK